MPTIEAPRRASPWLVWLAWVLAASVSVIYVTGAHAQHDHAAGHPFYQGWVNGHGGGCCNNQDCGRLDEKDERTIEGKLEVRIEGKWCPVLPWHYLRTGNAPDWNTAHVCVRRTDMSEDGVPDNTDPCDRLLCYQPKPLF